jgi:uncharacterized protein (TIGR00730 family)
MPDPEIAAVRSLLEKLPGAESQLLRASLDRADNTESAVRVFIEFLKGYQALGFRGSCVTVFGSARFQPSHPYYKMARDLGARLARAGFIVMTGGGPGIMEAANRGAKEAGGYSVGCNIVLPHEQEPNPYLDKFVEFDHFFVRKVMLVKYSCAFVVMPGGFGTLDEAFETLTLIQCGKIQRFPLVAMGTKFWGNLRQFGRESLIPEKTISPADLDLMYLTDSVDDAVTRIIRGIPDAERLALKRPKGAANAKGARVAQRKNP